jgi:hypothetical protein
METEEQKLWDGLWLTEEASREFLSALISLSNIT